MNTLMIISSYRLGFILTGIRSRALDNFWKTLTRMFVQSMTTILPRKPTVLAKSFKAGGLFLHSLSYLSSAQVPLKKLCTSWLPNGRKDSAFPLLLNLSKLLLQCSLFQNMPNSWKSMQNLLELK